jgi:hypothetical protein
MAAEHGALLGTLSFDAALGGYVSEALPVPSLHNRRCRFVLAEEDMPGAEDELRAAVERALRAGPELLASAEPHVLQYCRETLQLLDESDRPDLRLEEPGAVWSHVQFGDTFYVSRREKGDAEDGVYLSLECSCDWEVEHGLQLVLREGRVVSKVGPFDGHLTSSDAFDDSRLAGVVYVGVA